MFRVKCPCCDALLIIDTRTRKVVGHLTTEDAEKSTEERFGTIVNHLKKTESERGERMEVAKRREAERKKHLENLFNDAQKKAEEDGDEGKPVGPVWD